MQHHSLVLAQISWCSQCLSSLYSPKARDSSNHDCPFGFRGIFSNIPCYCFIDINELHEEKWRFLLKYVWYISTEKITLLFHTLDHSYLVMMLLSFSWMLPCGLTTNSAAEFLGVWQKSGVRVEPMIWLSKH